MPRRRLLQAGGCCKRSRNRDATLDEQSFSVALSVAGSAAAAGAAGPTGGSCKPSLLSQRQRRIAEWEAQMDLLAEAAAAALAGLRETNGLRQRSAACRAANQAAAAVLRDARQLIGYRVSLLEIVEGWPLEAPACEPPLSLRPAVFAAVAAALAFAGEQLADH